MGSNPPETRVQLAFDFDTPGDQDGMANLDRLLKAQRQRYRDVWAMPVGELVRVTLAQVDEDYEGILQVDEEPGRFHRSIPLKLRVGRRSFVHTEIESLAVIKRSDPA